jgi:hypothetical protein
VHPSEDAAHARLSCLCYTVSPLRQETAQRQIVNELNLSTQKIKMRIANFHIANALPKACPKVPAVCGAIQFSILGEREREKPGQSELLFLRDGLNRS